MKHFFHFFVILLFMPLMNYSQDTLSYPTDIVYDEENQEYFVSNWADDQPGYILQLNNNGEIIGNFYSSLDLPGGLCLVGDTLYVLNNKDLYGGSLPSYLLGIDINTGQLIVEAEIGSGGIYVDMVSTDNKGFLYITDSENQKIYKYNIQSQTFEDFVTNVSKPIGICYNDIDDRIVFTISSQNISYIATISPDSANNYTKEFYVTQWMEGLVMDADGEYYFSSWTGSGTTWGFEPVYKVSHGLDWYIKLDSTNNRPFGMCMGFNNHLAVCNWGSHFVNFIDLTPFGVNELRSHADFDLYPNPTMGVFQIDLSGLNTKEANLLVYDISGKEIYRRNLMEENLIGKMELDFSFLNPGTYFITVVNNKEVLNKKLIVY